MPDEEVEDELTELVDARFPRVDLVGKSANNAPRFLIAKGAHGGQGLMEAEVVRDLVEKAEASTASMNDRPDSDFAYIEPGGTKDEHGRTVPRSLRHFPVYDEPHTRNALSRAPQSPFGDKAMSKIRAAADKFGIEVAKAAADLDAGGDVLVADGVTGDAANQPGSAEWETIDSQSAQKWAAVLARAKNAISTLVDREMAEGEQDEAVDLSDALCALDCAIEILAPYAVGEQAEADSLTEGLASITKAAFTLSTTEALSQAEGLATVMKAGRTLSSANEAKIRAAVGSLQEVLMSLPAAPVVKAGAITSTSPHEESGPTGDISSAPNSNPDDSNAGSEVTPTSNTTDVSTSEPEGEDVLGLKDGKVAKASAPLMAVYSQGGKLLGAIDPEKITPLQDGGGEEEPETPDETEPETPAEVEPEAAKGAEPEAADDLTPVPPEEAGTPAAQVVKSQEDIIKSAVQEQVEAALVAKEAEQASVIKALEDRIHTLEESPEPSRVLSNGALPPPHLLRGLFDGAPAEVMKAAELQGQLETTVDAGKRAEIQRELNVLASAELVEIRKNPTRTFQ